MSTAHSRTYIGADDDALQRLPCQAYKILRYLVNRADVIGRCWPGIPNIASSTDCEDRTAIRHMALLESVGMICYLRRNQRDEATGRWLPNVYQVSPHYLAVPTEHQAAALDLWKRHASQIVISYVTREALCHQSHTNQHQEPTPKNQHQRTNTNNQQQQPISSSDEVKNTNGQPGRDSTAKRQKVTAATNAEKGHKQPQQRQSRDSEAKNNQSPAHYKSHYENPPAVGEPLAAPEHEALAQRLRELNMPAPLARGMIVKFGWDTVQTALNYPGLMKKDNPVGFFRWLVQRRLVDPDIPDIDYLPNGESDPQRYAAGPFADYLES